jgi:hypothetical protein
VGAWVEGALLFDLGTLNPNSSAACEHVRVTDHAAAARATFVAAFSCVNSVLPHFQLHSFPVAKADFLTIHFCPAKMAANLALAPAGRVAFGASNKVQSHAPPADRVTSISQAVFWSNAALQLRCAAALSAATQHSFIWCFHPPANEFRTNPRISLRYLLRRHSMRRCLAVSAASRSLVLRLSGMVRTYCTPLLPQRKYNCTLRARHVTSSDVSSVCSLRI